MDQYTKPATTREVEMAKLDVLLLGPEKVGKTALIKSLKTDRQVTVSSAEDDYDPHVGMNIVKMNYRLGIGSSEQTVQLSLWDPAMTELKDPEDQDLVGINHYLRLRYQEACRFHALIVCFDSTSPKSFQEAVAMYKELIVSPYQKNKASQYAKVPVAFVATKLDLTDFVRSTADGVKRAVPIYDVQTWLKSVHKRAENAAYEISAQQNIGVAMMVEWVVKAGLRSYQKVEKRRWKKCARFSDKGVIEAQTSVQQLLEGASPAGVRDEVNEQLNEKRKAHKNSQWQKYVRQEERTAVDFSEACTIF